MKTKEVFIQIRCVVPAKFSKSKVCSLVDTLIGIGVNDAAESVRECDEYDSRADDVLKMEFDPAITVESGD